MKFLRRAFGLDQKRGTLTFLADGRVIVGFPEGATDELRYTVAKHMGEWLEKGKIALFPFPVDVDDRRDRIAVAPRPDPRLSEVSPR